MSLSFSDHPYMALLEDDKYHRLVVKELPGKVQVIAMDVDYGNMITIHYNKLRKIPESFIMLPSQAYCCCLADVKPCHNETWTIEVSVNFLLGNQGLINLSILLKIKLLKT